MPKARFFILSYGMWKMKVQIRLRAVLFAGGMLLMLIGLFLSFQGIMPFLDYRWWKIQHTWAHFQALEAEPIMNARLWAGLALPLFFGFPVMISLVGAVFVWGMWPGIPAIIAAQILGSILTILITAVRHSRWPISDSTVALLQEREVHAEQLAFVPRLFLAVPTRVTDAMIATSRTAADSPGKILFGTILGLSFRVTIQGLWANSLINLVINFLPVAELEVARFLAISAVLVFMYLWPRIPELLPKRPILGELFLDLTGERSLSDLPPPRSGRPTTNSV